jgi:transcriptional regulator with XRE-family HTH domain
MPKSFVPTNIGFIINELREKHKLRAVDLADAVKLKRSNIHAIENIRTNPSLHTLVRILNYFGYELRVVRKKDEKILGSVKFIE